jgi:GNAT superfamily N-acetyltransferase
MALTFRPYESDGDYWRMRGFLREVFVLNDRHQWSWHVARLDYARWHTCLNLGTARLQDVAFLWEEQGSIAAILMADGGPGEAHLLVHPHPRTPELEDEMLDVAEAHLAATGATGANRLEVWSPAQHRARQEMLSRRGYTRDVSAEYQWRRHLDAPVADAPLALGYSIRSLGDGLELLERCYASGLGFHEGDITVAVENRADPAWYRNIQTAPLYRRDLDLVAVASDGAIAAFCTLWFDDVTRSAYFEPVATVPAHRRRGLGRAVMHEGLRRVQRMGATVAVVSGEGSEANALYRSVMGPEHDLYERWAKEWAK